MRGPQRKIPFGMNVVGDLDLERLHLSIGSTVFVRKQESRDVLLGE
jgi:hypothetical protein